MDSVETSSAKGHLCLHYYVSCHDTARKTGSPQLTQLLLLHNWLKNQAWGQSTALVCVNYQSHIFNIQMGLISLTLPSQQNNEGKTDQAVSGHTFKENIILGR